MKLYPTLLTGMLMLASTSLMAQTPLDSSTASAVDATVGNRVLQLRYLTPAPFSGIGGNLDYGVLLTENREFIGSAALMFDTDIVPLSRLKLQVGPRLDLAWLDAGQKTDVFAASFGAAARYDLIPKIGLSVFGSGFYSPGVLTFGSAHNMYDFTAGAEARLAGRLYVLGGYRWLKFTLVNEPDEKVSNELFAGVRWQLD
ncbi:MAG TPA: YfaZ family outer membrane protein [Steroidobacteraceae bacterium]|nr:YfaZ family outer membrane protein [Steroidobacteraceae bacterium]